MSLSEREIQAVVDYVMVTLQAKGEPTMEACFAFWGQGFRTGEQAVPAGAVPHMAA